MAGVRDANTLCFRSRPKVSNKVELVVGAGVGKSCVHIVEEDMALVGVHVERNRLVVSLAEGKRARPRGIGSLVGISTGIAGTVPIVLVFNVAVQIA